MTKVRALRDNIEHGTLVDGKNVVTIVNKGEVFEVSEEQAIQLAEHGAAQLPKGFKVPEGIEIPEEEAEEAKTDESTDSVA